MINKHGFRVTKFVKQEVTVGATIALDAKLELGSNVETVEVYAAGVTLDTGSATVGNTLTGIPLDNLPGLGRDVSTFVTLQPGVAPDGSVAGANQDQNSFMLDGGNNSSDMDGTQNTYTPSFASDPSGGLVNGQVTGTAPGGSPGGGGPTGVMPTPADSIEEFKVGTNNQTADFNSSAGAQVQMVTKRGTNQWHGTAYEYYLDNTWGANSFNNDVTGTPKPSYHYNRFGASGGGPLVLKGCAWREVVHFCELRGLPLESVDHHYKSCSAPRPGARNSSVRGSGLQSEPDPGDLQWSGYLRTNAWGSCNTGGLSCGTLRPPWPGN